MLSTEYILVRLISTLGQSQHSRDLPTVLEDMIILGRGHSIISYKSSFLNFQHIL